MKTLVGCKAGDLVPGDLVRGLTHNRIVTGPPVRVIRVRPLYSMVKIKSTRLYADYQQTKTGVRISYFIIGRNQYGWRDVSPDMTVTVERDLPPFKEM